MPLFSNPDDAVTAVANDLGGGFEGIFAARGALVPVGPFADEPIGSMSDEVSVLAWELPVTHIGPLQGTPATGKDLTLRGVTVIRANGGDPQFSRYIDWLALYAEIGAITIARPVVDDRNAIEGNVAEPVQDDPVA